MAKAVKKGKKKRKPKRPSKRWEHYQVSGDKIERKLKFCPKCGDGVFLAKHKNRETCGTCGYTVFSSEKEAEEKKPEAKKEEVKKEPEKKPEKEEIKK